MSLREGSKADQLGGQSVSCSTTHSAQTTNQQGLIETTYACRVVGPANILTGLARWYLIFVGQYQQHPSQRTT